MIRMSRLVGGLAFLAILMSKEFNLCRFNNSTFLFSPSVVYSILFAWVHFLHFCF